MQEHAHVRTGLRSAGRVARVGMLGERHWSAFGADHPVVVLELDVKG